MEEKREDQGVYRPSSATQNSKRKRRDGNIHEKRMPVGGHEKYLPADAERGKTEQEHLHCGGTLDMKKLVLLTTTALLWFSIYIYNPYLTPELLSLHLSASIAGVIVGARPFMQMFVRFPMGMASDRSGKHKHLVVAGNILAAAAGFLMFIWPNPVMITIGCMVAGFASATYVAYTVLFGSYFPKGRLSMSMGLIGTIEYAATCIAFIIGGSMYKTGGIRSLFLVAAIAGIAGTAAACMVRDTQLPPAQETRASLHGVVRNPELQISGLLGILTKLVAFGTAFSFTTKLAQDIGASGGRLGITTGLYIAAAAAGSLFVTTTISKRIGHILLSLIGFSLLAVYCIWLPFTRAFGIFLFLQAAGGFAFGELSAVFMANAIRTLPVNQKTAGMGIYQSLYSFGMGMGSVLVGLIAGAASYAAGFLTMAAVAAAGFLLVLYAARRHLITGPKKPQMVRQRILK